jgi:transposase
LKAAVQAPPSAVGIDLANWNWKVVRQFIEQRTGQRLSRSTCLRYLHRLDFVLKRPKKRLLKADPVKQAAFVEQYVALLIEAEVTGAKIFFVDEAHFRADGDLRGKWVLKGEAALVDSLCPRWGAKASYYSAVCLETGEVEVMALEGNSTAETSTTFLQQLRAKHLGPVIVIWDNAPAHGGEALRQYLRTPDLQLRLVRLPGYSPEFNADEAIWDWAREEVTANTCLGTKAKVQAKLTAFFAGLAERTVEVKRRCRTELQARAAALMASLTITLLEPPHVDPICALV